MRADRLPAAGNRRPGTTVRAIPVLPAPWFAPFFALWLAGCQVLPATRPPAPVIDRTPPVSAPVPPVQAPPPAEPYRNVYTQEKDSAPDPATPAIDYDALEEPLPKAEPRSRYGNKSPYFVNGKRYEVLADASGYREEGIASWYGRKFHGFRTSSMERYDMHALTAAHKSLPIPSYVRVTHLENRRSVIVRVNDRGPFHGGRLIDLSWAAAQRLGYINRGTARVLVEALALPGDGPVAAAVPPPAEPPPGFFVQFGAFAFPDAANRRAEAVRGSLGENPVVTRGEDYIHRVRLGPFPSRETAVRMQERAREGGLGETTLVTPPGENR